jgi:cell division protein FtsW (lipid II flippase)
MENAAFAGTIVLLALACFQVALAAGAPLGHFAWGGAHRVLPRHLRIASAIATLIYAAIALVMLEAAGVTDLVSSDEPVRAAMWVLVALFGLGTVMNAISRSRKERVMAIVSFVLGALALVIARWPG